MNPVVASLLLSLESVFSLIAGWVLLGQRLSVKEQFGCLLVFCALSWHRFLLLKSKNKGNQVLHLQVEKNDGLC